MNAPIAKSSGSAVDQSIVETLVSTLASTMVTPFETSFQNTGQCSDAISAVLKFHLKVSPHQDFDPFLCTVVIAELEQKLQKQLDAILHAPVFQRLESVWRSLLLLVEQTPFEQNIKIDILNVSHDDLLEDLDDAPEITRSGLYKLIYSSEYGQFGGEPYGVMMADYYLQPSGPDLRLMSKVAAIAAMSHTPFITGTDPDFFDIESMRQLPGIVDLPDIYNAPRFSKWKRFRNTEDARYIGMVLPRFLLRGPYVGEDEKLLSFGIHYEEENDSRREDSLWGNSAFLFVLRLVHSFSRYRWCPHIIGPAGGGLVEELIETHFPALKQLEQSLPVEVMITDRREYELTEAGFIALTPRRGENNAAFYSANSVQSSKFFGTSTQQKKQQTNFKLGGQLPYLFIINRIAHYLKVIQRENIGTWKEQTDVQNGLNQWIKQYVSDQENPSMEIRNRRPLRKAKVTVQPVEGEPGWYRASVEVRPHFKYMGADFTLSLVGKLEVSSGIEQHRQQV